MFGTPQQIRQLTERVEELEDELEKEQGVHEADLKAAAEAADKAAAELAAGSKRVRPSPHHPSLPRLTDSLVQTGRGSAT